MRQASHTAARAAKALPPALPELASFGHEQHCQGLAFLLRAGSGLPDLAPLRGHITDMLRGSLGEGEGARDLLVVLFDGPPQAHARHFPAALPLIAAAPGQLTSFLTDLHLPHAGAQGPFRSLHLFWGGKPHRIALALLDPVPLALLWQLPPVTFHKGAKPSAPAHLAPYFTGEGASVPKQAGKAKKVRHSFNSALARSARGDDPFGALRSGLGEKRSFGAKFRSLLRDVQSLGFSVPRAFGLLFSLLLWSIGILVALAILVFSAAFSPFLLIGLLCGLIYSFLRGGDGGAGAGGASGQSHYKPPGMFENFFGWMRWHLPFGSFQRQLDARVRQVKALAASGQIDEALRLALRLGGGEPGQKKLKKIYPGQLPNSRAKLDFEIEDSGFTAPVMPEGLSWELRQAYEELAQQLEKDGDYRRAAFIRSQLLEQHEAAAKLLDKGDMVDEAAQLALAAKVEPAVTVPLLYKAGRKDAALALARRAHCFEQLVRDSRGKDAEFHVLALKTWTDILVETGQDLRAVQVTDEVASELKPDQNLLQLRRAWLSSALMASEQMGFAAEPVARALLTSQPSAPDLFAGFPRALPQTGDRLLDFALAAMRDCLLAEDGGADILALVDCLVRLGQPNIPEQQAFWTGAGPAVIEALVKGALAKASPLLDRAAMERLQRLLQMARLQVLAYDLSKLSKLLRAAPKPREYRLPPASATAPRALAGCLLGNGSLVVWRDSDTLELYDRDGALVWRSALSLVTALVRVGSSGNVLVLQSGSRGRQRVSRLDTVRRSLHEIGEIDLWAHHDVTSESAWLVQIGGEIGALDLAKLCAAEPGFDFLWSCSLTDRLQAVAFLAEDNANSWITIDVSPERRGMVEIWRLTSAGKLTTSLTTTYGKDHKEEAPPPQYWRWLCENGYGYFQPLDEGVNRLVTRWWSEEAEAQARAQLREKAQYEGYDGFIPCDMGRSLAYTPAGQEEAAEPVMKVLAGGLSSDLFTLRHDGETKLFCLARVPSEQQRTKQQGHSGGKLKGGKLLMADNYGRLLLVDPVAGRVTLI